MKSSDDFRSHFTDDEADELLALADAFSGAIRRGRRISAPDELRLLLLDEKSTGDISRESLLEIYNLVKNLNNTWGSVEWVDTTSTNSTMKKLRKLVNDELRRRSHNQK